MFHHLDLSECLVRIELRLNNFGKNTTGDCVQFLFCLIYVTAVCLIFEDAKFNHLVMMISVGFPHCKVTFYCTYLSNYLQVVTLRLSKDSIPQKRL